MIKRLNTEKNTENLIGVQNRFPVLAEIMEVVLIAKAIELIKIEKGCKLPLKTKLQDTG